jgi:hypothetical protein
MGAISWALFHGRYFMGAISWALCRGAMQGRYAGALCRGAMQGRYAGALCRGAMQGQQNFYNLRFRFFNNEPFRLSLELR